MRVLVVFQYLLAVDRSFLARFQHIDEPFTPQLFTDEDPGDRIGGTGLRIDL